MRRLFSAGLFSSKPSSKSRRRAAGSASETSDDEVPGSGPSSSTASSSLGALGILEVSASESSSDDAEPVCIVGMDEIAATQPLATALAVALEGSSAAAARAACVDAVEVGRTTPDCARQLAACGAALTVLRILARWHAEEPVAEAAFAAVRFICSDDDASDVVLQIFLSRSDLLDEWLGAMQRFFSARQLQLHGVCVLGIHVKKSTKIAESLDRGPRVMRAMVFAMTSHRGDAEIQRVGAAALHFVARKSKWSTEVILGLGVTDVLRSAMEGHQVDGELQRCAIFALATLVKLSDKAVPALLRADISPTLLAAMSAYPSDVCVTLLLSFAPKRTQTRARSLLPPLTLLPVMLCSALSQVLATQSVPHRRRDREALVRCGGWAQRPRRWARDARRLKEAGGRRCAAKNREACAAPPQACEDAPRE